jgi:flagellar protein FlaG
MASVSVSHMILFIASILVAASVVGVFTDSITQVSDAIDDRGLSVSENVRTDVEVISDSGSSEVYRAGAGPNGEDVIVLHVKNTGTERLTAEPTQVDVLVDGRYESNITLTLADGADSWRPGKVVRLNITRADPLPDGDHRVKLIVNQDEEVFEFRK